MKTSVVHKTISSVTLLAAGYLLLAGSAVAQWHSSTIKVPFDFSIGTQALPAGEYHLVQFANRAVISLRGVDDAGHHFIATNSIYNRPDRNLSAKLVFHQYGDDYFLAEIWFEGSSEGRQVQASKAELEHARLNRKIETKLLAITK